MAVRGPNLQFLQIGANDGCHGDPLRKYVLELPWRGIVVEPQPDVFSKLCANYEAIKDRLIFENIAIASDVSAITMYRAKANYGGNKEFASTVASTDAGVIAKQLGIPQSDLDQISVPCATLDKLVKDHGMAHLDILQIDAEGQDLNVLMTLNLAATAPLIVQIEHGHLSPQDVDRLVQHLNKNGYRVLYGGRQTDTIALHESFPLA